VDQQETLPVLRYDNVLAAVPLPVLVNLDEMMGDPLVSWESRDAAPIIEELEAQGIITSGASQVMYVPDSFTTASRPGIQVLPLGQGRRAADFVMGASIIIESESDENGCGFVFRRLGEERYSLFFLDGLGGVGLAGWDLDRFEPFVYELIHDPVAEAARDRVILVAQGDRVSVYVNGEVVFVRPNTPVEGGVGISSLSFDGSFVNCRFIDTWLWTWE